MASEPDPGTGSDSNDLVARVNMDPDEALVEPDDLPATPMTTDAAESEQEAPRARIIEIIPLGLIALIVIAISMLLILQGVFEMIPN